MRIIALMNQKGGVGKTTTTVNLGAALAEMGKRVLLIDLDPQAHLSINYGVEPAPDLCSLYNLLVDGKPMAEAVNQVSDRIWLIPSSIDLAAAEIELVHVHGRETLLKQRLDAYLAAHPDQSFDYVLLDCPPSLGLLTINALSVASEVLIPMQPHFLALQGVAKLLETVQLVSRRMNPRLKVSGIVLTMFDAQTKLSVEVVNELNGFILAALGKPLPWASARVFDTKIRRNIKLAEAPSFGKPILDYDGTSNGAADYRALAREVAGEPRLAVAAPAIKPAVAKAAAPPKAQKAPAVAAVASPPMAVPAAPASPAPVPPPVVAAVPLPVIPPAPVASPAPPVVPTPLRPVAPAPRIAPSAPAHRTGTAAATHLIAATATDIRRPMESDSASSSRPTRSTGAMLDEPPQRTGPLRPVPPLGRGVQPGSRPSTSSASTSPLKVTINTEIDPAKLAASARAERNAGVESPDDSEAMA